MRQHCAAMALEEAKWRRAALHENGEAGGFSSVYVTSQRSALPPRQALAVLAAAAEALAVAPEECSEARRECAFHATSVRRHGLQQPRLLWCRGKAAASAAGDAGLGGIFAALGTCLSACLGGKAAAGQGNAVGCGLARAAVAEEGIEA